MDRLFPILLSSGTKRSTTILMGCGDKNLHIPHRIYASPPSDEQLESLDESDRVIVCCWFTRHHDGHVREAFLRKLQTYEQEWVMVYVLLLCSEYVVEILDYIWQNRDRFDQQVLGRWHFINLGFSWWVRDRIISYWNCYYRTVFPELEPYVGGKLIAFFQACESTYQQSRVLPKAGS